MKFLFIFSLITANLFAAYSVCVPVTINHLKVPNTDQTDFAIPVCANGASGKYCDSTANSNLAATSFKTVANGGKATSASGFDINWFSDSGCTASLPFYFVAGTYSATTGYGKWYVKKTVLTASDVTIYAGVGNASITTDQSTNAWASTFKAVWPMSGVSDSVGPVTAPILADATGNGFNLTAGSGSPPTSKSEQFGANGVALQPGANSGSNNNDQPAHVLASGLPTGTSDRTLIFYSVANTIGITQGFIFGMGQHSAHKAFDVKTTSTTCANCCGTGNVSSKQTISMQCNADDVDSTVGLCQNQVDSGYTLHQIAFKLSSTGSVMDLYLDGALDIHSTGHACNTDISGNGQYASWNTDGDCVAFANCFPGNTSTSFMYGKIADSALSADYIATENNAVSSPETFLTFGSPIVLGGIKHKVNSN